MKKVYVDSFFMLSLLVLSYFSVSGLYDDKSAVVQAIEEVADDHYASEHRVDVYTNKGGYGVGNPNGGTFQVGELITIFIMIKTESAGSTLTIHKPSGPSVVETRGKKAAGTYQVSDYAGLPVGTRQVVLEVGWLCYCAPVKDYLYFDVVDSRQPTPTYTPLPPPTPTYTPPPPPSPTYTPPPSPTYTPTPTYTPPTPTYTPTPTAIEETKPQVITQLEQDKTAKELANAAIRSVGGSVATTLALEAIGVAGLKTTLGVASVAGVTVLPPIASAMTSTLATHIARDSGLGKVESIAVGTAVGTLTTIGMLGVAKLGVAAAAGAAATGVGLPVAAGILIAVGIGIGISFAFSYLAATAAEG